MSKKNKEKKMFDYDERFESYFTSSEEGEYITKAICSKGVTKIYIYSTLADVEILPSSTSKISATLQGELYGEQFYFTVFRLKNKVYVFATCNVERVSPTRLFVTIPKMPETKVEVVTNRANIIAKSELVAKRLELKAGKGLQKKVNAK